MACAQETTFRSAKSGVKGIPRCSDADFDCTEKVHGSGLPSQKEMMSPREGREVRHDTAYLTMSLSVQCASIFQTCRTPDDDCTRGSRRERQNTCHVSTSEHQFLPHKAKGQDSTFSHVHWTWIGWFESRQVVSRPETTCSLARTCDWSMEAMTIRELR